MSDTIRDITTADLYELIKKNKNLVKAEKAWTIRDICINWLVNMFEYKKLPESIPQEFLAKYLTMNGNASLWVYDNADDKKYFGEWIASIGGDADNPDVYGIGENYIAVTQNGYTKTLTPDIPHVIIRNNSLYKSDMDIINQFADLVTEMFISLNTNILYARLKPVFKAVTDTEKNAIENAFKNIKDDLEPIIITSKNVLAELEGEESTLTLDITDVKNADKLQYIIKAIEDAFRWFLTLYGQSIQGNSKLAQQTKDEVKGSTSMSFILPNDMLRMRRVGIEAFNKISGLEVEVDFSDAWKTESIKYKAEADIDENGQLEELDEIGIDTQTEEQTEEQTEKQTEEVKEEGENE